MNRGIAEADDDEADYAGGIRARRTSGHADDFVEVVGVRSQDQDPI